MYHAGDICWLIAYVCNPGSIPIIQAPVFVVLDMYGTYYFAPSFTLWGDHYNIDLDPGVTHIEVIPEFFWPEGAGRANGVIFWGAETDPAMTTIIGNLARWEFGWDS